MEQAGPCGAAREPNTRHAEQKVNYAQPIGPLLPSKKKKKNPQNCVRAEACIDNTSLFFFTPVSCLPFGIYTGRGRPLSLPFLHTGDPGERSPSQTHKPSLLRLRPFSRTAAAGARNQSVSGSRRDRQAMPASLAASSRRAEWQARRDQSPCSPSPRRRKGLPVRLGSDGPRAPGASPGAESPRVPRTFPPAPVATAASP